MSNEVNQKILDYLKNDNLRYDENLDKIFIKNIEADDYDIKVICAKIKEHLEIIIDKQRLKDILMDIPVEAEIVETEKSIIKELSDIIDNDDTIENSDWEKFKIWKNEEALWKTNKDGEKTSLCDCFENIVGFIENYPKTKNKIRFNKIRNIVEYNGRQVVDSDYHMIINLINKYFIPTFSKIKMIKDAVDNVGFKNQYNPWIDYFNKLEYIDDGIDYIDYTIKEVLCCEEQDAYYDLYYETLKLMLLANMSRIYNEELYSKPTKFDVVTTLCGTNGGSGKTTFFERLYDIDNNGNTYCYVVSGDSFNPKDKDFIERSHQCVCLFLDEVSMKRAIVTSVKGYITQQSDKFRKAYGFNNEDHLRRFIITASSNNTDILKDYTTNNERRWAIIKISENTKNYENVNKAFNNGFRDKLWAFIKNIYNNQKYNLYMTDDRLIKLEEYIQRDYKASNNEDYYTIIHDLLEREYGFYDEYEFDIDSIVAQYRYGNSKEWCEKHNEEIDAKMEKSNRGEYIMQPKDKKITYWGKIDRIRKTTLYEIINKLNIDFTKPSLSAELKFTGIWEGCDNKPCTICGKSVKAYWRKSKEERLVFTKSEVNGQTRLPF